MKCATTFVAALWLFSTIGLSQELTTRMLPGTSLPIPAELVPLEGEPIKCGFPVINHYVGQASSQGGIALMKIASALSRYERQTAIAKNGFRVHFDTTGLDAPALVDTSGARIAGTARAYVDSVFSALARVVSIEIDSLHYLPPASDGTLGGGPEYDIYIEDLGSMYGETFPDEAVEEGGRTSSSITIDNDFSFVRPVSNRGMGGLRVTLAHEFHHALQIGNYGYWTQDAYFYEITSTWMEDVVYPEVNDYYNYLKATWGQFRNPERPFNYNDSYIPYSRAIWGHFIAKRYGADVMRETWEDIALARPHIAADQALRTHGSDFAEAIAEWSLWNYYTGSRARPDKYYTDGADYPEMIQTPIEFTGSAYDQPGSLRGAASNYWLIERGLDTMTVITSNTDLAALSAATNALIQYTLRLRSSKVDDSYRNTPIGIYSKLNATDLTKWSTWYVVGDSANPGVDPSAFSSKRPFPSPFRPAVNPRVYIPLDSPEKQIGSLFIISTGNDLVRSIGDFTSSLHLGREMFSWDGLMDNGKLAPTGVYIYIIELPSGKITGKIALVRE
jgi:hypothetical protein